MRMSSYVPVIRLKMAISGRHAHIHANKNGYFYRVRFLATGIIMKHNTWATTYEKKIEILSTEFLAILICIYESKLLVICFSPNAPDAPIHHPKAILLW